MPDSPYRLDYCSYNLSLTPTLVAPKDLKPNNILITLPNAEEALQRYTVEVSESEALPPMPVSSPPVILSRPIMPLSLDDLQNANHIQSNYEIQLTDFGTGERWLSDASHTRTSRSHLSMLFSNDGGRPSFGHHPALCIARPRGYPG